MSARASADAERFADRLVAAGMSVAEAHRKGRLFAQAGTALAEIRRRAQSDPAPGEPYRLFVPGRIEVLGKHTDYAGGRSLLAAVERGFAMVAAPRRDATVCLVDAVDGSQTSFSLDPELTPTVGHWSNYPMTVARRIARNFAGPLYGADVALVSDLPPAAGMSSSSAMICGLFQVLSRMNALPEREEYQANIGSPETLAGYLATIENGQSFGALAGDRGVGTFGGSEDHTAICCCGPGRLHMYAFCPVRLEHVLPFPAGYVLAVGASGVLAEKTGAARQQYNRASHLVRVLLELWQAQTGRGDRCLAEAIRSGEDAADRLRRIVARSAPAGIDSAALLRRLEHFLAESERIIPTAAQALAQGAIDVFGQCVDQSQRTAEELLENQIPPTIYLARAARQCGAAAASAFGAGFGGSVWAMVPAAGAEAFLAEWQRRYRGEFPAQAPRCNFFLSGAGPALMEL